MKFAAIAASALVVVSVTATTPAPTAPNHYDEALGCWPISVEHDATYCIDGPICSGSGPEPAGWLCPVAGDAAIADCHSYLVSYTDAGDCVLPVDAKCQVIKTGAWGCVLSGATPSPSTPGSTSKPGTPSTGTPGTGTPSTGTPGTSKPHTPTPTPNATAPGNHTSGNHTNANDITFSSAMVADSSSVSAGTIAAIAAAAAVVCAAIGTVLYKKYHQTEAPKPIHDDMVDVVTP